ASRAGRDDHRDPKKSLNDAGDSPEQHRERRGRMMQATKEQAAAVGVAPVCRALALPRATVYRRWQAERTPPVPKPRPAPRQALSPAERQEVLDVLHET